jgi:hypothetical protein
MHRDERVGSGSPEAAVRVITGPTVGTSLALHSCVMIKA